jgi:hypothetical protein
MLKVLGRSKPDWEKLAKNRPKWKQFVKAGLNAEDVKLRQNADSRRECRKQKSLK